MILSVKRERGQNKLDVAGARRSPAGTKMNKSSFNKSKSEEEERAHVHTFIPYGRFGSLRA
jgi:hypothetical protein